MRGLGWVYKLTQTSSLGPLPPLSFRPRLFWWLVCAIFLELFILRSAWAWDCRFRQFPGIPHLYMYKSRFTKAVMGASCSERHVRFRRGWVIDLVLRSRQHTIGTGRVSQPRRRIRPWTDELKEGQLATDWYVLCADITIRLLVRKLGRLLRRTTINECRVTAGICSRC